MTKKSVEVTASTELATPLLPARTGAAEALARAATEGDGPRSDDARLTGKLRTLLFSLLVTSASISLVWGAVPNVWLPLQVQTLVGDADKGAVLALVTGIGALGAMVSQPLAGMLSDRTRTRFGRRAPWLVGGALVGGLGMIGLGAANSITWLVVGWMVVQIAYNFAQGPFSAVLPDRVPSRKRGLFAAIGGFGGMLGSLGGSILAASFAPNIPSGYLLFAGVILVVTVLFAVLNPDQSSKGASRPPFSFLIFLKTFWVNPVKYPDFFWGFVSRFAFVGGYFLIAGYQLYILQDYIGLGADAVAMVPALSGLSLLGIVIATLIGGPLSDRLGRRKPIIFVASMILAASIFVPVLIPTGTGMLIFAFGSGLGFGAFLGVDQALMTEVLPSKTDYAKDLGVLNIAQTLPQTISAAVAGVALVVFGEYWSLFPIAIGAAIIGGVAVLFIKSVR